MNVFFPRPLAALIALSCAAMAHAREPGTVLDALVVTGTRTATTVRDNPASVSIVERETIENSGADSIAELLRDVPGVSVVDSAVAGMQRIRIRGEQSNRVVILVDGQELTDHSSFGSPLLVDPANIERIEVVRGPASVLYGAKAIGGVINIITRKGAAAPLQAELGATYDSGTSGWRGWTALSGTQGRLDWRVSASADEHGDRRVAKGPYSASGRLDNSSYANQDVSAHLGLKLDDAGRHYLALKANHHSLRADGWQDPFALVTLKNVDINPTIAGRQARIDIAEAEITQFNANLPKRDLNKLGLYYEGKDLGPVLRKVSADAFVQRVDREFDNLIKIRGRGGRVQIPGPGSGINIPLNTSDVVMGSSSTDRTDTWGASVQLDFRLHPQHYSWSARNGCATILRPPSATTSPWSAPTRCRRCRSTSRPLACAAPPTTAPPCRPPRPSCRTNGRWRPTGSSPAACATTASAPRWTRPPAARTRRASAAGTGASSRRWG